MALHFLALLYPKPDRIARVEEIASKICDDVQKQEPGVLKYQWFRTVSHERPLIVVWETYIGQEAVDTHKSSPIMAWLIEVDKQEDNMAAPIEVMPLEQFAGWDSRS